MSVLEIVAEKHLGAAVLKKHPQLGAALRRLGLDAERESERERVASIVELCFEFDRESDPEEKANILRTLEEISANEPLELATESLEEWDTRLKEKDRAYAKADIAAKKKAASFLKKYFALRSRAGLSTQADVARKSGLARSYVAVIESGEHVPQQKTLQKLSKALGVDITELLP